MSEVVVPGGSIELKRPGSAPAAEGSPLTQLGAWLVFPTLVMGTTLVQQPRPALVAMGQVLIWLSMIAAACVVIATLRAERTILLISLLMVGSRLARVALGLSVVVVYETALNAIFVLASIALLLHTPRLLHRQLILFMALCAPLMILQAIGAWDWPQALRTDSHQVVEGSTLLPALFVDNRFYDALQARPSGLVYANNYLTIIIVFAAAVHFGLRKGRRLDFADWILAIVMVMSMSKLVLLALLVFSGIHLIRGVADDKIRTAKYLLAVVGVVAVYAQVFPGLFLQNTDPAAAVANVLIRWVDFKSAFTGGPPAGDLIVVGSLDGSAALRDFNVATGQSGYSEMAGFLPYLGLALLVAAPFLRKSWIIMQRTRADLADSVRNGLAMLLLIPVITSFLSSSTFWFAAGPAFLPAALRVYASGPRRDRPVSPPSATR